MLFFINSVYQDDPESQPYHLWIHRFIYLGVALLPVYSIISFYGLSLRVEQYGWSLARCWAFLLWFIFAAFSIAYLVGILRLRDHWLRQLSWVNVRMGLFVMVLMLLINSPILDFRKITVNSQMARLDDGSVLLKDFDFRYFRYELARPGYEALQELKESVKDDNPEILVKINSFFHDGRSKTPGSSKAEFIAAVEGINDETPDKLVDYIYEDVLSNSWKIRGNEGYHLFSTDLNEDGLDEFILAAIGEYTIDLTMYFYADNEWKKRELRGVEGEGTNSRVRRAKILDSLKAGEHSVVERQWRDLKVGDFHFQVP